MPGTTGATVNAAAPPAPGALPLACKPGEGPRAMRFCPPSALSGRCSPARSTSYLSPLPPVSLTPSPVAPGLHRGHCDPDNLPPGQNRQQLTLGLRGGGAAGVAGAPRQPRQSHSVGVLVTRRRLRGGVLRRALHPDLLCAAAPGGQLAPFVFTPDAHGDFCTTVQLQHCFTPSDNAVFRVINGAVGCLY